jgi:catechol 2,3-dioxygenase-like lactoylglutathione lyase family enzyme
MALTLNHFSIRTTDLEASRRFYADVLGLSVGPRPDFPFPGLWMYRGDHADLANAVVHLIGIDHQQPQGLDGYLGGRDETRLAGSGAVDHLAFFADGLAGTLAHLAALGVAFRQRTVPSIGLHQLFLEDPCGVAIELNFPASEQSALTAPDVPDLPDVPDVASAANATNAPGA